MSCHEVIPGWAATLCPGNYFTDYFPLIFILQMQCMLTPSQGQQPTFAIFLKYTMLTWRELACYIINKSI